MDIKQFATNNLKVNKIVKSAIMSGIPTLLNIGRKKQNAFDSYNASIQQYKAKTKDINKYLLFKLNQTIMWGMQGKIYNTAVTEMIHFVPGAALNVPATVYTLKDKDGKRIVPKKIFNNFVDDLLGLKREEYKEKKKVKNSLNLSHSLDSEVEKRTPQGYVAKEKLFIERDSFSELKTEQKTTSETYVYIKYRNDENNWFMIKLRPTIGDSDIADKFLNNWQSYSSFGRTQKNYIYSETDRSFPLKLFEFAYSKEDLEVLYEKINYLAKANYPKIKDNNVDNTVIRGTVIYVTIGNLFVDIPCIINDMTFTFPKEAWDIHNMLPTRVYIDMNLTVIYQKNKHLGSEFYLENGWKNKLNYDKTGGNKEKRITNSNFSFSNNESINNDAINIITNPAEK